MNTPKESPAKKTYVKPELQIYGNLTQITAAVGMMNNADGGPTANNQTQAP